MEGTRYTQRLLVDIDCLFDTRIGWLAVHHPEVFAKLPFQAYRNRFTDTWAEIIGIKDWHEHFRKRDVHALIASKPTVFFDVLGARLEGQLLQIQLHSPLERPSLTINLYPYTDLNGEETHAFERMFREFYDMVHVDFICEPPERLTTEKLTSRWDGYAVWDWFKWIECNAKHFEKKSMPGFLMIRTAMFTPELTPEVIEKLKSEKSNPFSEAQRELAPFLSLETIDSALFSLDPRFQDAFFPATCE